MKHKKHLRIAVAVGAVLVLAGSAFATNVATPVPVFNMPASASYNTAACAPTIYQYRTVTAGMSSDGVVAPTVHYPGYTIDRNGAISPEHYRGSYRVNAQGMVEATDDSNCKDGVCELPKK